MSLADPDALYPFEVWIAGSPVSLQASSKSRDRWRAAVRLAALDRVRNMDVSGLLGRQPLALTVHCFTEAPMEGDLDNIVKPIMDALILVAYLDDKDVEKIAVQRFDASFDWTFASPSDQLAAALGAARPIVYIRVDADLDWRRHA